ncbi:c-type cytochrome biogenesis protein CcsB [Noviherbaspirillum sp.]|jgi:cytochrome c-type biogenesis protein CcsB|uniref:c-type cytochrome biogenesis protein CcsB n=1 Tax=Noviherbaspirillum sp. TaxID=1926288 RepID=UPI0025D5AC24|nr:c-type cytochrome biogenesis protein CcsB [Noviherbaspirillum sp.]
MQVPDLSLHTRVDRRLSRKRLVQLDDLIFVCAVAAGSLYALLHFSALMDVYEIGILLISAAALAIGGMRWRPIQRLSTTAVAYSLLAVLLYHGSLESIESSMLLKYLLSSQANIMWMGVAFWGATFLYGLGWIHRSDQTLLLGSRVAWLACFLALAGLLIRWHESYLLGADIGHIPVSNLYEVFVLFSLTTTVLYLYLEQRCQTRLLGAFVMLAVSAAVGFTFWYGADASIHEIQPLIPALKSYWMKMHVPANFIGYGAFSIAAMLGAAQLLSKRSYFSSRLPSHEWIEEFTYKAIALGFVFFTIATILGALWAAEAWGGYWSWDPKETWALIVWINYAAWLHMRLIRNVHGPVLAWWAIVGFVITLFAFLGVNIFLSGLHSYGSL